MVGVLDLWLAIVLAAVLVFIASSVIHMVVKWHNSDYKAIPDEAQVLGALREHGVHPGGYVFPHCTDMKQMAGPEMTARYQQGPVGFLTVLPNGPPAVGKSLLQWFVYTLVLGVFVGYIGTFSLQAGAAYSEVFRVTGTVAILAYCMGNVVDSIWKGVAWSTSFKFVLDGVIYGLLTAGTFGWLWPDAV